MLHVTAHVRARGAPAPRLAQNNPGLLWGKSNLLDFWKLFRCAEPEHPLWKNEQRCSPQALQNTLPLSFHGDEGAGLREISTLVLNWKSVLCDDAATWRNRYVIAVLPARRRVPATLQMLLAAVAESFKQMFDSPGSASKPLLQRCGSAVAKP